jgi:tyrosyl-tRNA synthetase
MDMEVDMNIDQQVAYLMQGTEYGDQNLKQAMTNELKARLIEADKEGRPLRVYCGFDPRTGDLHLGHTVVMRKLRQFQELGHEVSFVIGNYTSLIGDPSDKDVLRPRLTEEEVEANARTYAEQAFRILDSEKTHIRYNADWLSKITFAELINLASNFTIQQFLTRENFRLRWEKGEAIYLHETFYSIMQAYDAYYLKTDVQVGGTDQLFNIVTAGRKVMSAMGEKPNIAVIASILPGTDGVVKMSKSLGNHIPINTDAEDMYGKMMSIPDSAMSSFSRLVTRWTPEIIEQMEKDVAEERLHPRDAKMRLAHEVVSAFYGDDDADKAQEAFVQLFQKHQIPDDMPEYALSAGETLLDVLINSKLCDTKSQARRMLDQNAVKLDGEVLGDGRMVFPHAGVLQVGKRNFIRVIAD